MNKFKILIAGFCIIASIKVGGQVQQEKVQNRIISFLPQYFINNGIRIDFDFRLTTRHWLQVSPQIYLSQNDMFSTYDITLKELAGIGIGVSDRMYLGNETSKPSGSYISYGISYNAFNINYQNVFDATNADPSYKTTINKYGADFILGRQFIIENILTADLFLGAGLRYAIVKHNSTGGNNFNSVPWGYGFTGTLFLAGFRIGIAK